MQLSRSFTLAEMVSSQTAARRGIANVPGPREIAALQALCVNVLQPLRDYYARPVTISSGYRAPALNFAIGGAKTSQHCKGEAGDIEVPGVPNIEVARWIEQKLPFDQLILEFYTPGEPFSGWVHVSYRGERRGQVLTARRVARRGKLITEYVPGLVA